MTGPAGSPGGAASRESAGPGSLGLRVTAGLLDRLAARATMTGQRDQVPIEMPATGKVLGHVPHGQPAGHRAGSRAHLQAPGPGQRAGHAQPAEGVRLVTRLQQAQPARFTVERRVRVQVAVAARAPVSSAFIARPPGAGPAVRVPV
jgi:hypothetical protein